LLPDLSSVDAILIGHSHFDHLLDLPYILNSGRTPAPVYGNRSMVNLLTKSTTNQLFDVEAMAGDFQKGGATREWQYVANNRIRFMALKSMHAPHALGITLFNGKVKEPRQTLPLTAWGWKCGTPLAFVIDFMKDRETVAYRMVFNDSAVDGCKYGLPTAIKDERPVDLAVLCMASFRNVKGYPGKYLKALEAKEILIAHWEDFFRPQTGTLKVVRGSNMEKFIKKIPKQYKEKPFELPAPGSCRYFSFTE
jgi:hypothetical protein